jgi:hypothetical protein
MPPQSRGGGADIVACDFVFHNADGTSRCGRATYLPNDAVYNIKHFVFGFEPNAVVWNKLVKRELYGNIVFPHKNLLEDKCITTQLFYFTQHIEFVDAALYHYRFNPKSLIRNWKSYLMHIEEVAENFGLIFTFLREKYGEDLSLFEPELSARMQAALRAAHRAERLGPLYPLMAFAKRVLKALLPYGFVVLYRRYKSKRKTKRR